MSVTCVISLASRENYDDGINSLAPWAQIDYPHLIDLDDFKFLRNRPTCRREDNLDRLLVVALVHSAPKNRERRVRLREHWLTRSRPEARLYFLFGYVASAEDQQILDREEQLFGDIIQGNFMDSYRNLTYKHTMALKWFNYYCSDTPFLLKLDDDVLVEVADLIHYLQSSVVEGERNNSLVCNLAGNLGVQRSASKWAVTKAEYQSDIYPPYCLGYIVIYPAESVRRIYAEAQRSGYFWIDDVHVTGTLRLQANSSLLPIKVPHKFMD